MQRCVLVPAFVLLACSATKQSASIPPAAPDFHVGAASGDDSGPDDFDDFDNEGDLDADREDADPAPAGCPPTPGTINPDTPFTRTRAAPRKSPDRVGHRDDEGVTASTYFPDVTKQPSYRASGFDSERSQPLDQPRPKLFEPWIAAQAGEPTAL